MRDRSNGLLFSLTRLPGSRLVFHAAIAIVAWGLLFFVNDRVDPLMNYYIAYAAVFATALFGMVILVGLSGQVSLGNGGLMAVGGYVFALVGARWVEVPVFGPIFGWQWNPAWSIVMAGFAGFVIGLLVGLIAARLRGPYLAGLTLGLAGGIAALANRFPGLLGGEEGLFVDGIFPPESFGFEFPIERWQAWIAVAVACIVGFFALNLSHGRQGRMWQAVRDDPTAASVVGISPAGAKVSAFVVSSVFAALAGATLAILLEIVSPGAYPLGLSLSLLVGVVLGGRTSLVGALIGAALLVALPEWVRSLASNQGWPNQIADNAPNLMYGALVVLVVLIAPGGIVGLFSGLFARLRGAR